jgi:S-methylmethionine-dependent homocysteine/selenocysteine methylase
MSKHRAALPQANGKPFLTDGGLETTLIFHDGLVLPDFAAFTLLHDDAGIAALRKYFRAYAALAVRYDTGLILESPTWRASSDWGARLGYGRHALAEANRDAIDLLTGIRDAMSHSQPVVVSGCIGPRGDGYVPSAAMTAGEALRFHRAQVETFADTDADMLCAMTLNYAAEAIGVTRAASEVGMPIAISFTVETDGHLPTGQLLADAIREVDEATAAYPAYYMINCAHPTHLARSLAYGFSWNNRIRGLRANASAKSHAELNESTELDAGNPAELASRYADLRETVLPRLNVFGGCCGTDHRHVESIAESCLPLLRPAAMGAD